MAVETTNISARTQQTVAQAMYQCVAETAVTTMMAQNFHWNVTGMAFGPLHELFKDIYEDHFQAQDELAERIRSIGHTVDGRLSAMIDVSKVMEDPEGAHKSDKEMVTALAEAQKTLATTLSGAGDIAAAYGDKLTEDLCVERGRAHEKFAWLLQSHIG